MIKGDAERTTKTSSKSTKDHLEKILTNYCKAINIKYKQGMNEVLAPFLILSEKMNLELFFAFNCFSLFINRFMLNIFVDEKFYALECQLNILKLLLKYHEPLLSEYLENHEITPVMYATPWFTTFFSK